VIESGRQGSQITDYKNILLNAALSAGTHVHEWTIMPAAALVFSADMHDYCKTNVCGNYGKSWTCPPACESIEEQKKKILSGNKVLVFTTKHSIEDSFDYEGMDRGRKWHTLLTCEVKRQFNDAVVYGAGRCPVCGILEGKDECSFPNPCPFPQKKIGSMEAAGINVTELSKTAGIAYNNGPDTVTFFSMVVLESTTST